MHRGGGIRGGESRVGMAARHPRGTCRTGVLGGMIGHYFGEAAGDVIIDQGVDRVAEAME